MNLFYLTLITFYELLSSYFELKLVSLSPSLFLSLSLFTKMVTLTFANEDPEEVNGWIPGFKDAPTPTDSLRKFKVSLMD